MSFHVLCWTQLHKEVKIPTSHKNAMRSIYSAKWLEAEQNEINSLEAKGVFQPMVFPVGKCTIDTK